MVKCPTPAVGKSLGSRAVGRGESEIHVVDEDLREEHICENPQEYYNGDPVLECLRATTGARTVHS